MKLKLKRFTVSILFSAMVLVSPLSAIAETNLEEQMPQALPPVLITEVQTGLAAGSESAAPRADEFIELYNTTDQPIDLAGWQLRYITASETSSKNAEEPSATITLAPLAIGDEAELLPAGGYYLLYSGEVSLPDDLMGQHYAGLLPATGGSLVLVSPDAETCEFVVQDALAWGSTTHLFGEGEALVSGSGSSNDRLFQRYVDAEGGYVDTENNAQDYASSAATSLSADPNPGVSNTQVLPDEPLDGSGAQSQPLPERFDDPDCTLPGDPGPPEPSTDDSPPSIDEPPQPEPDDDISQPVIPAGNIGLRPPMLSELLPNPASPQTDKDDEFIELYNPNDAPFELSGYIIEVGLKTKKRYVIPDGAQIGPRSFLALFSADTRLALSNSGSQVMFADPLGKTLAISEIYANAKDGQAWILANGKWQWTTKPTPNAINIVSAPPAKKSSAKNTKTAATTKSKSSSSSGGSRGAVPEQDVREATEVVATTAAPLHPGVLALIAASAILYGAYEYRRDVANKIYQFRTNRAARRALRQSVKGR